METSKHKLKAKERHDYILNKLNEKKEISVAAISQELSTSVVTIRKDLETLERSGLLERIHGGAVLDYNAAQNQGFAEKLVRNKSKKKKLASFVSTLISPGESILLNSGTTPFYIAQELKHINDLIVITNSFQILNEIGSCKNITTIFLGGQFDADTQLTYGDDVLIQLKKYSANKVFISVDGVSLEKGATSYSPLACTTHRQMLTCAKEKYLIADDSKLNKAALVHIADLNEFDALITTETPGNRQLLAEYERQGIKIISV